jgi:hypothetical protein
VTTYPISFFGPIAYYQSLAKSENVLFEVHETYQKQSIRNRYSIGTSNGILDLSIPITKPNGSKTLTKDILIEDSQKWKMNHWRAITSAYMHTPYFEHYESDIHKLIFSDELNLFFKNNSSFEFLNKTFDLKIKCKITEEYEQLNDLFDFRNKDFLISNTLNYIQPFANKHGFIPNLSILDLLFCEGPMGRFFLKKS